MNRAVLQRLTFCRGFTLVELALVLLIVAILIGGLLVPLSTQMEIRNVTSAQETQAEIREALLGYAARQPAGRPCLPCPDTDGDGVENRASGTCANQEGSIPWVDLGLGASDPWNNRYRYRVSPAFSNSATGFSLTANGTLRVCADAGCVNRIAENLPAVILSHGKNGAGAVNMAGTTNAAPSSTDELENTPGGVVADDFVSRTPSPDFDDIVIWLPSGILVNRMIAAGTLP